MIPGRIAFTRMWSGASSFAAAFVRPMIAALDSGVVDPDVDAGEFDGSPVHQVPHLAVVGHVAGDAGGEPAGFDPERLRGSHGRVAIQVRDDDGGTL